MSILFFERGYLHIVINLDTAFQTEKTEKLFTTNLLFQPKPSICALVYTYRTPGENTVMLIKLKSNKTMLFSPKHLGENNIVNGYVAKPKPLKPL